MNLPTRCVATVLVSAVMLPLVAVAHELAPVTFTDDAGDECVRATWGPSCSSSSPSDCHDANVDILAVDLFPHGQNLTVGMHVAATDALATCYGQALDRVSGVWTVGLFGQAYDPVAGWSSVWVTFSLTRDDRTAASCVSIENFTESSSVCRDASPSTLITWDIPLAGSLDGMSYDLTRMHFEGSAQAHETLDLQVRGGGVTLGIEHRAHDELLGLMLGW